jgi:long-chain-fatty-acid--CoA ligase ACSBG
MEKIHAIKDKLPHLKAVIQTLPPYAQYVKKSDGYWCWNDLKEMDFSNVEEEYQKRAQTTVANECCCLIYTSGTSGKPKGVMLSHDNLIYECFALNIFLEFIAGEERVISYLPLSHVAGQVFEFFLPLYMAGTVYFADRDALKGTLDQALVAACPTYFFSVPRVYEKIQEKMMVVDAQSGALKKVIDSWAKRVTLQRNMNQMAGSQVSSIQYKLAEKLILSKIKHALGLQDCRNLITGGAPMSVETKKYFMSLDLSPREIFGMSETAGVHCGCPKIYPSFETVGKDLLGMTSKVLKPDAEGKGEICIKGRHVFMGYLNDEEKTMEAIDDDGWLHTGDFGYVDKDGYVFITGRIKELIITSGGENIPPVLIENLVKGECAALSNAFLVGDKRKFLTMLVTLKTKMNGEGEPMDELSAETLKWLEEMDLKFKKLSEVLAAGPEPKVVKAIHNAINQANKNSASNAQKVQKFAILPHDFSIPTGELGPTLKLKRNVVAEKYNDVIEKFYK